MKYINIHNGGDKPMENPNNEKGTQGKTEKDIINQDKKQTQTIQLVSPKADVLDQARLRPHITHEAKEIL
jgi:hypothetical protein